MTVTTHAAVSIFFFFCFHMQSLQHTLHISWHTRFMLLGPPIVVGVILTYQNLDPEYKTTTFFQMYFHEKKHCLIFGSIWYIPLLTIQIVSKQCSIGKIVYNNAKQQTLNFQSKSVHH